MELSQDNECCICMDEPNNVMFSSCGHKTYLKCAVKIKKCPLCRTRITQIIATPGNSVKILDKLCTIYPSNDVLFNAILCITKGIDPEKVAKLALQLTEHIGGHLSLAQAETILIKAKDEGLLHYLIQNNIVKLCNQPWLVNRDLGGSGMCYHGNYGEILSLDMAIRLLENNIETRCGIRVF